MITRNRIAAELAIAALLAACVLCFGINGEGMASGYVDPLLHAGAQDEAVYGHASAVMVRTGHWLTPIFLERFMLNKPPLLMWSGAISMRLLGVRPLTLRLPVLIAGVLCCVLVYWWLRRGRPIATAMAGLVLLAGTPMFFSIVRKFMTDGLLTLFILAAMMLIAVDPRWEHRATAIAFGVLSGAAIMTKSVAGLLPFLILAVYWLLAGAKARPPLLRIAVALATAVIVAAPWHLYEFTVHRDWFVAEYVRFQLLGSGVSAPSRYTEDTNFWFYCRTLFRTDPILLALWLTSLPWLVMAWNGEKRTHARLLAAWLITVAICLGIFGTRAAYYLLPLLLAMALASAEFSPLLRGRFAWGGCAALIVMFGVKVWAGDELWGLDYEPNTAPGATALDNYSRMRRSNELLIVSPDDEFYASVLDLPKVRYVYLTPLDATKTSGFFFQLGMILTDEEFCSLGGLMPVYEQRLHAWKLPLSLHPEGTLIASGTVSKLPDMIRCSTDRDFMVPDSLRDLAVSAGSGTHIATGSQSGKFFLLSKITSRRSDSTIAPGTVVSVPPQ